MEGRGSVGSQGHDILWFRARKDLCSHLNVQQADITCGESLTRISHAKVELLEPCRAKHLHRVDVTKVDLKQICADLVSQK